MSGRTGWGNTIRRQLGRAPDSADRSEAMTAVWEIEQALDHAEMVAGSRRDVALRALREVDHILSHNPNVHDRTRAVRVLRDAVDGLYPEFDWEREDDDAS